MSSRFYSWSSGTLQYSMKWMMSNADVDANTGRKFFRISSSKITFSNFIIYHSCMYVDDIVISDLGIYYLNANDFDWNLWQLSYRLKSNFDRDASTLNQIPQIYRLLIYFSKWFNSSITNHFFILHSNLSSLIIYRLPRSTIQGFSSLLQYQHFIIWSTPNLHSKISKLLTAFSIYHNHSIIGQESVNDCRIFW